MSQNLTTTDDLLNRGIEQVIPSRDFLASKISDGKKIKVYAGIDPTGPTLHIGHAIVLRKLKQFQELGHSVVLLIGDFTAQIGDPTDKTAVRKPLTEKEIKNNLKVYKRQAEKFLHFSGKNKAKLIYNSSWLKKLRLKNILELTSLMTVEQMLKRDMFAQRIKDEKPIFIHEFLYPLLQGYDSVMLDVDVEVGGNDQMFNMLVGRDFQKKLQNKDKIAITMKLLTDNTGKKMGKTEGNMITLQDSHFDMYGKIMSWTDGMILPGFELCTDVSEGEIQQIKTTLENSSINPRDIKSDLAKKVVAFYYGEEKAEEAAENFTNTFKKGEVSEDALEVMVQSGTPLSKILVENQIVSSVGEFKRLVGESAVSIVDGEKVSDFNFPITSDATFKIGKRRFLKVRITT